MWEGEKVKKKISCMLAVLLVLSLSACGGREKSAAYTMETELESGVKMTDTLTLNAKGDTVQQITEVVKLDMTGLNTVEQEEVAERSDTIAEQYRAVEGVECTTENADGVYSMTIVIPVSEDTVSKLAEQNLLTITGGTGEISMKSTEESLLENNYTLVEE